MQWIEEEGAYRCFDGLVKCPDHITPDFLEVAKNQPICTEQKEEYYCRFQCSSEGDAVWQGSPCPTDGVQPCPPWPRTMLPGYDPANLKAPTKIAGPQVAPVPVEAAPAEPQRLRSVEKFSGEALVRAAEPGDAAVVRKIGGFDLRGIQVHSLDHVYTRACVHSCNCCYSVCQRVHALLPVLPCSARSRMTRSVASTRIQRAETYARSASHLLSSPQATTSIFASRCGSHIHQTDVPLVRPHDCHPKPWILCWFPFVVILGIDCPLHTRKRTIPYVSVHRRTRLVTTVRSLVLRATASTGMRTRRSGATSTWMAVRPAQTSSRLRSTS